MARLYLCLSTDSDGNKIIKGITCNKGMMKKFCREQSDGTFLEIPSQDLFYKIFDSTFILTKDTSKELEEQCLLIEGYYHKYDEPVDENNDEPEIPPRFFEKERKQREREERKQRRFSNSGSRQQSSNFIFKSKMKR